MKKKSIVIKIVTIVICAILLFPVITAIALGEETITAEPTANETIPTETRNSLVKSEIQEGTIFEKVDWGDKIISFIIALIQATIIAIVTKMLLDKAFSSTRAVGRRLRNQGITRVSDKGRMSIIEINKVFGFHCKPPVELWLLFLTGCQFFEDFENKKQYISKLAERGCNINILLCNPNQCKTSNLWGDADYSTLKPKDIPDTVVEYYKKSFSTNKKFDSFIERQFALNKSSKLSDEPDSSNCHAILEDTGDYYYELQHVIYTLRMAALNNKGRDHIHLRYYEDEFRSSFLIAMYDDPAIKEFAHTTLNAPVRVATESVSITLEKSEEDQPVFFDDLKETFLHLWDAYKETEVNW